MRRRLLEYYKTVQDYHRIAEESHANQIFPADLILKSVPLSGLVLDVAGGTWFNAEFLRISPDRYICVDLSPRGLEIAREKDRGVVVQADAARLPVRNGSVDNVLCSWSLEHFPNPEEILEEMIRVLRPGGKIAIWGPKVYVHDCLGLLSAQVISYRMDSPGSDKWFLHFLKDFNPHYVALRNWEIARNALFHGFGDGPF